MSKDSLTNTELALLKAFARLLMPATQKMPAADAVASFANMLPTAITASGISPDEIKNALAALPSPLDWGGLTVFAASHPAHFENLSVIVSGTYVMLPEVLGILGFPEDRRNPAGTMDAAEEYETGVLDPVVNRGPVFRDPRKT